MRSEGMFAQAREAGLDMEALGAEMRARKEELLADFKADGLPVQQTHTMKGAPVEHVGMAQ
jgi:hypothetical protein